MTNPIVRNRSFDLICGHEVSIPGDFKQVAGLDCGAIRDAQVVRKTPLATEGVPFGNVELHRERGSLKLPEYSRGVGFPILPTGVESCEGNLPCVLPSL